MTPDHAVFTGIWTLYIFVGSYLKDERLAHFYGETYRNYQHRVTGYPFFGTGPLGYRRQAAPAASPVIAGTNCDVALRKLA
jgi:hypothetical protein